MESNIYNKRKISSKIDIETQKIYLVKAIHDIETGIMKIGKKEMKLVEIVETNVTQNYNNSEKSDIIVKINNELESLEQNHIFEKLIFNDEAIIIAEYDYVNKEKEYTVTHFESTINQMSFNIEKKTGKIISINFNKNILNKNIDKKEVLENYVKYLNLYIIDDWTFENNSLKSEKAGLYVSLINDGKENYILSIYSGNRNFDNLVESYATDQ